MQCRGLLRRAQRHRDALGNASAAFDSLASGVRDFFDLGWRWSAMAPTSGGVVAGRRVMEFHLALACQTAFDRACCQRVGGEHVDLKSIEALLAIADTGTVTAAAKQLDISRASVRRRLDALEADVGAILMHRADGPVRLTPAGRLLAARGEALVRGARAAAQDARAAGNKPEGMVRMITLPGAPVDVRARLLDALTRMNPGLHFDLIETEDPLVYLDDEFDMLVYFGEPLEEGAFFMRSLARVQLGLMASPAYLETHGAPQTVADLADHRVLAWRPTRDMPDTLPGLDGQAHPISPVVGSASMVLIREMAAQGVGIAWGSLAPIGPVDAGREVVPVLPDVIGSTVGVWLVCPLPSKLDPRVRVMLEGLLEMLKVVDLG